MKVEPIKRQKDIATMKRLLENNPRDYCLFVMGINLNLRASDLIRIRAKDVRGLKEGEGFQLKEKKTQKYRAIILNRSCIEAIKNLLSSKPFSDDDLLFPITAIRIHQLVSGWCKAVNLKGNYGSHSLRKTWAYWQRVKYNVPIPVLMTALNHSSQKQTLDYLCISEDEVRSVFLNEI